MRSTKAVMTKAARYGTGNPGALGQNAYSRCQRGRRADLGAQFFRSAWEANYARFLNFQIAHGLIQRWEYEPTTFVFHGEVRGVISYTPDFRIFENDGSERYDEIKGWMTSKDRTKMARMAKHYPAVRLRLVGEADYRVIDRQCRGLIPGWE